MMSQKEFCSLICRRGGYGLSVVWVCGVVGGFLVWLAAQDGSAQTSRPTTQAQDRRSAVSLPTKPRHLSRSRRDGKPSASTSRRAHRRQDAYSVQKHIKIKPNASTSRRTRRHRRIDPKEAAFLRQGDLATGRVLYQQQCASCHHERRQGRTGSPLLPLFLRRRSVAWLDRVLVHGKAATLMPGFPRLTPPQRASIIRYIRTPGRVAWGKADVQKSLVLSREKGQPFVLSDIRALTAVVERGKQQVWLMEGTKIHARFPVQHVHGGIKFQAEGKSLFVPSRDGWVTRYDVQKGRWDRRVRACVYLRNIALVRGGEYVVAACWLPRALVILRAETLEPVRFLPLDGMISAIYTSNTQQQAIFTMQDRPEIGFLEAKDWSVRKAALRVALSDFFLDPSRRYLVGSSPQAKRLFVYDLHSQGFVFDAPISGMPHLFSVAFWYEEGRFYFATPHMGTGRISVWEMYRWRFVKDIAIGGPGAFVRTHPMTPYLWADNGSDQLVLIEKKTWKVKKLRPVAGRRLMHTEFSADGVLAYLSVFEKDGALLMMDAITLQQRGIWPASWPVGKYNFVNKQQRYAPVQLGYEVFMARCWGCHHTTQTAFAPSFLSIAEKRHPAWIRAQLLDPKLTAKHLGYKRSVMPKIPLRSEEIDVLIQFILDLPKNK